MNRFFDTVSLGMRCFIATAAVCGSCITATTTVGGVPNELELKTTWLPRYDVTEYRITVDGVIVKNQQPTTKASKRPKDSRRITLQAWKRFESELAGLKVKGWKRSYSSPERVYDGYFWKMRFVSGTEITISEGHNAGPSPTNPEKTVIPNGNLATGDLLLAKALERLWESSSKSR